MGCEELTAGAALGMLSAHMESAIWATLAVVATCCKSLCHLASHKANIPHTLSPIAHMAGWYWQKQSPGDST